MEKILFITGLLLGQFLFSQEGDILNVVTTPNGFYSKPVKITKNDYKLEGSPYINGNQFEKVIIKDYSKNVQDLRYNAYEDEMEFKTEDEVFYANKIDGLTIYFPALKKIYRSLSYFYDGKSKSGYLVLLVDHPKYSLYKREKIELLKGEKSTNSYSKDANDYYAKDKDLYLVSKDKKYYKFPKNISEAAEILSIDKKELETFTKSNKINFNKEPDIIKFVEFINQR